MKAIFTLFLLTIMTQTFGQTLKDCSTCSVQIIKVEQIKDLSIDEIRFLTNDLFARKGYKFSNSEIDWYYSNKSWYKPVSDNNQIVYNLTEKQNIKLFQERTKELKSNREKLLENLNLFKTAFIQNDEKTLESKFNFSIKKVLGDKNSESYKYFYGVLNNINIDEIGWFKNQGHYKKRIDNLTETYSYELVIDSNDIYFRYDFDSGSEDIKEEIYPSDIFIEFTYLWKFKYLNNQLKFIDFGVIGS